MITTSEIILKIQNTMINAGLKCPANLIADGKIQRFSMIGDTGKPCWYVIHIINNGLAYAIFGCWKRGIYGVWCSRDIKTLPQQDLELIKQKRLELEIELQEKSAKAKRNAQYIWEYADPNFTEHPYLTKKQVKSFGLRLHQGLLLVPLYDENNELCSLQFINSNGDKWFKKDASVKDCFFIIGEIKEKIYIAEGYATAATIHEITGDAVVVAFNALKLLSVAKIIRKQNPYKTIIICADNDAFGGAE